MKPEGAIFLIMFFGVVASTIWATVDAAKQERYKYKGYNGAFIVFLGCAFCWIIFFPIYLFRRSAIVNGAVELRPEYANNPPPRTVRQAGIPMQPMKQAATTIDNRYEQLQKLGEPKAKGLLTEEEFVKEKSKLM